MDSAQKRIGLIAGEGELPVKVAHSIKSRGFSLITIVLTRHLKEALFPYSDSIYHLGIGQSKKILNTLKSEGVRDVIIIGRINKKVIFDKLAFDLKALKFLREIVNKNDDTLMSGIAQLFEKEGLHIMDQRVFLKELFPEKGVLTKREPAEKEWKDIRYGFSLAKEIARLDIGETIVVKNQAILAVEAIEGTDKAIERGCALGEKDAVVIKVSRVKDDFRMDVPAIGTETLKRMIRHRASVLALEYKKIFIVDLDEVLSMANEAGISIVVMDEQS